jgi:hypothetical protein
VFSWSPALTTHLTPLLRYCLETTAAKLSDEFPKPLTDAVIRAAHVVVT